MHQSHEQEGLCLRGNYSQASVPTQMLEWEPQPPALPIQLGLCVPKTKAKDSLQRRQKENENSGVGRRCGIKDMRVRGEKKAEKYKLRGESPNRLVSLTPAPGSMPGPHGGTAGNTRSPTAGLDLPLPASASPAALEEVTLPGAPDLPPAWPCSRDSNVWR